jgi:catechol 2,3-dioxygenase-like lactoylglutathione lyase family enzyme
MFAQIRHVAMFSENYAMLGKFYESLFGMKTSGKARPMRAVTVGDGYVGLNINPRRTGRKAGLDHFGIQVADLETVYKRMRDCFPEVEWLARPSTRPFAGVSAHDPDGNVFDISQQDMKNRTDVYTDSQWQQPRTISHVAIRTLHPEEMARFYTDVFELTPLNKAADDPNYYLSDGHLTLELMPWRIGDYAGMGVYTRGIDHFGFKVESIEALKADMEELTGINQRLAPMPFVGKEGAATVALFKRSCPLGTFHLADTDGVPIDVAE